MRSLPRSRSLVVALLLFASAQTLVHGPPAHAASGPSLSAYRGLGSWVDIYDLRLWTEPETVVGAMHAHGVRTLFLETGNWRIDTPIFKPAIVARYVDEAHRQGMDVVAWYVPDFKDLNRDLTRALAAIDFTTPSGERFDSFGLDIEATQVRDVGVRTTRMLRLSSRIRDAVGSSYPLAAIVPSPYAMELIPTYWPGFPFVELAAMYDVFAPMGYFTFRTNGPDQAAAYTSATLQLLAERTSGAPVHAIGGLAENTSGREVDAFVATALGQHVIGASLYDFGTTGPEDWTALAPLLGLVPTDPTPKPKATHPVVHDAPPLVPWSLRRSHWLAK